MRDVGGILDWVVTFDETWRAQAHRTPLPGARRPHPEGFVLIRTDLGEAGARAWAESLFGGEYTDVHPLDVMDNFRSVHPLGCLGVYDAMNRQWMGRM